MPINKALWDKPATAPHSIVWTSKTFLRGMETKCVKDAQNGVDGYGIWVRHKTRHKIAGICASWRGFRLGRAGIFFVFRGKKTYRGLHCLRTSVYNLTPKGVCCLPAVVLWRKTLFWQGCAAWVREEVRQDAARYRAKGVVFGIK